MIEDFPDTTSALTEPNGLLAVGGDLSPGRLLRAYMRGIFPWFDAKQPILWWSPDPRSVLLPGGFHAARSFRKKLRSTHFNLSVNSAFDDVVSACAAPRRDDGGTWISPAMQSAYRALNKLGVAHSIEVYWEGDLVGGLYGVALGRVFFGESMFSRVSDASKTAFAALAVQMHRGLLELVDCQVSNPHLVRMGAQEISRLDFETTLFNAIKEDMEWLNTALDVDPSIWPAKRRPDWLIDFPTCAQTVLGGL